MKNLLINYKYRTREAAFLDLLKDSVYFSLPSQFHETNDILEGEFETLNSDSLWVIIVQAINNLEMAKSMVNHLLLQVFAGLHPRNSRYLFQMNHLIIRRKN